MKLKQISKIFTSAIIIILICVGGFFYYRENKSITSSIDNNISKFSIKNITDDLEKGSNSNDYSALQKLSITVSDNKIKDLSASIAADDKLYEGTLDSENKIKFSKSKSKNQYGTKYDSQISSLNNVCNYAVNLLKDDNISNYTISYNIPVVANSLQNPKSNEKAYLLKDTEGSNISATAITNNADKISIGNTYDRLTITYTDNNNKGEESYIFYFAI